MGALKKITPEAKDLIVQLHKARKEKRISQSDLAKKTGLTQKTISLFENAAHQPRMETIYKYAKGIGCKVTFVINE